MFSQCLGLFRIAIYSTLLSYVLSVTLDCADCSVVGDSVALKLDLSQLQRIGTSKCSYFSFIQQFDTSPLLHLPLCVLWCIAAVYRSIEENTFTQLLSILVVQVLFLSMQWVLGQLASILAHFRRCRTLPYSSVSSASTRGWVSTQFYCTQFNLSRQQKLLLFLLSQDCDCTMLIICHFLKQISPVIFQKLFENRYLLSSFRNI